MAVTAIKCVVNRSPFAATLTNTENPDTFRNGGTVEANGRADVDMWIAWARSHAEHRAHHITVLLQEGERRVRRFSIWQGAHVDGDYVRVFEYPAGGDTDVAYHGPDAHIGGVAEVGGDRQLVGQLTCLWP